MKKYEFAARNVQDAIAKGLKELNQKQEDVDIKILSEGGLFSKAKIAIITTEQEEEKPVQTDKKQTKSKKETKAKKQDSKKEKETKTKKQENKKEEKTTKQTKENKINKTNNLEETSSLEFIKTLAEKLVGDVELSIKEEDNNIFVDVEGEKAGNLIGYRGESLTAIQYLASVIENNNNNKNQKSDRKRIILNIENYRQKREESLTGLAKRIANKAIKTQRTQRLEPMNAYDRRIVHSALTDSEVITYSKGNEPKRYLVIEPKK
jgi:spoIIIJ-associated protein